MKTHPHSHLMVTRTGWVSRFLSNRTATSHSRLNKSRHTLSLWLKHTISIVIWDYIMCWQRVITACKNQVWGGGKYEYTCFPTVLQYSHCYSYTCVYCHSMCVCVSTHIGQGTWDNKGCVDLHHALTCFTATMCVVWMSQQPLPPSSPYTPPQRHCENTSPPWFPDVDTPNAQTDNQSNDPFPVCKWHSILAPKHG